MRRYVVGLDDDLGLAALDRAVSTAVASDAEVHAVFVQAEVTDLARLVANSSPPSMERGLERLVPLVRERVARLGPRAPVVIVHGVVGSAADALVACAAVLDAEMIFVGTHRRTGISRLVRGSVAEQVVRSAGCPVTVVRGRAHDLSARWPALHRQVGVCGRPTNGGSTA